MYVPLPHVDYHHSAVFLSPVASASSRLLLCGPQPERIQGAQYTVKSDVWSLGISLIELALGRFPFSDSVSDDDSDLSDFEGTLSPSRPIPLGLPPPKSKASKKDKEKEAKKNKRKSKGVSLQGGAMTMSILELLQHIVNEPAPRLTPEGRFPKMAENFVDGCLLKDPELRQTPKDLLVRFSTSFVHLDSDTLFFLPSRTRRHSIGIFSRTLYLITETRMDRKREVIDI